MLRTQISLTVEERRLLDEVAARTGRSVAALIRDAVDATYGKRASPAEDVAAMRQAFGAWERQDGGEVLVERLRSGRRLQDATDETA